MKKINKNKDKKNLIKKIILMILIIIVGGFLIFKLNDYIILGKNKSLNLVINNKNVTNNLKKEILIKEDQVYISKNDLGNFFDKYIYEDKNAGKIITTYDTKVAALDLNENTININGTKLETQLAICEENGEKYLPIEELKNVYGIEIEYLQKTKVVVIDSIAKEQKKAIVKSSLPLKSSKKLISKTLDRVKKGSYVVIIEQEDKYTKIRTENGKIGYIKTNKLANEFYVRENLKKDSENIEKINLVWDYYSTVADAPDRTGDILEGVNVVSPAFFYIDSNGELKENIGNNGQKYVEWAHKNGYKVWPMVQNAGDNMLEVTSKILNDYNKRQKIIDDIVTSCIKYKLDGINVDFENMKKEDKDMYSRFIIELTPRLNDMGLEVSVDVTAPDGADTWSMCFDRNVIGDVANYIVFMAYDEYGASSNKAGTTAGYDWIEISLKKFIQTEEIDTNKIILAIPLYARLWTENSSGTVIKQSVVPLYNMNNVIPKNVNKEWNDKLKQYYVEYVDGNNTKKIWIEDEKSLKEKLKLIKENNLGGVASWEKGMEYEGFWTFLNDNM